jgi:hypothetical protein
MGLLGHKVVLFLKSCVLYGYMLWLCQVNVHHLSLCIAVIYSHFVVVHDKYIKLLTLLLCL